MTKLSKYIGLGVLASGLFFGTILTAYADDPATNDNNGPAQVGGDHGWNKKDWGDGWKDKFGLTDDQSKQLKDLFKKQREETKTLADQMKIDMDTLKLKVDSKASDGQIKALLDKISSEKKELQAKREHFMERSNSILTPTQQAEFLLEKRGHGMWGRHGKMDGPGCEMGKACPMGDKGKLGKHKGHMKKDGNSSNVSTPADSTAPAGPGDAN